MYFEINVSLSGKHFFATAPRSLTNEKAARGAYTVFVNNFPESDGYRVSLTRFETIGHRLADNG